MIIFTPNTVIRSVEINANFSEALQVTSHINPYKFHAYRTTNQSILSGTWTTVGLNTEVFDDNNNFDTTTYKYTVPLTGYYQLNGQTYSSQAWGNQSIVSIVKNATSGITGGTTLAEARGTISNLDINKVQNCSCLSYLTAGDTLTLVAHIDDSSATIGAGLGATFLSGFLISTQ